MDSKMGFGSEVEGNGSLIRAVGFVTVPRMKKIQTILMLAFQIAADIFDLICDGRRRMESRGLQHSEKDKGAVKQPAVQGNVFAYEIVTGEVSSLDEEILAFIPARDFNAISIGPEESFRSEHGHL